MEDTTQQAQEETVEINIPAEQTGLQAPAVDPVATPAEVSGEIATAGASEVASEVLPEVLTVESNPQETPAQPVENQPQTVELSTDNPQTQPEDTQMIPSDNIVDVPTQPSPPVPGAGRKCEYCENKEKYQHLADDYVEKSAVKTGEKVSIPFVEELALIIKKDEDTVNNWAKRKIKDSEGKETEELEHPEFADTIKRLKTIQKLRLLQRTLGRFNPTGAIFQLKVNHNLIETEKKVLAGDINEPLLVEIINEDRKVLSESE